MFKTQNHHNVLLMKNKPVYVQEEKNLKFVKKNCKDLINFYMTTDKIVERVYPDLIQLNLPKMCQKYKDLNREDIYEIYIQFKTLLKICMTINKDLNLANLGIDNLTFHRAVPEMSTEDEDLAKKIFKTINTRNSGYMILDEFLNGMVTLKSNNISDKLSMFFKIIDTNGDGTLSWKEVLKISKESLARTIKGSESEDIIDELAEFFARLIFKLVDVDKSEELKLENLKMVTFKIINYKQKIINGGKEALYLEMFCCADNFKSNIQINL